MARKQGDAELFDVIHKVESGDNLSDIAKVYYGDGNLWEHISQANGNLTNESLKLSQSLVIPCKISITKGYQQS